MDQPGNPHPLLAYENPEFVESEDARPLRIFAEYLEPLGTLRREHVHETIVFFGSARLQPDGPPVVDGHLGSLAQPLLYWGLQ